MTYAKVMVRDVTSICSHCPDTAVEDLRSYFLFAFTSRRCRCLRQYTCREMRKVMKISRNTASTRTEI